MTIIIGLGNPGTKFENTRHNVGFDALDAFAAAHDFPGFVLQKKSNALVSKLGDILLVKPQTFMNESGVAVQQILKNNPAEHIVIVHDDIDLPLGKIKVVQERGSAGHKGVESIIQHIGNDGLVRFRIGIAGEKEVKATQVVLKKFSKEEQKIVDETIQKTADAVELFIKEGLEKAMNEYN